VIGEVYDSFDRETQRRRFWRVGTIGRRLVAIVTMLWSVRPRGLFHANIGTQLVLLSLVTTVPFLTLIVAWSIQESSGAARTILGLSWATLAAVGLGLLSHRRLSVPIVQLSATAQRIGQGDFTVRVPVRRLDELGQLGDAMNAMAADVERLTGELLQARDQLAQTSQTQREFIALASHELCAPVSSLRTYAEALLSPDIVQDESERQYSLQRIEHLSIRLGAIVRNLLSASRIRAGQLQVECEPVALGSVVRGCVDDALRQESLACFAIELPQSLPPVLADGVCLEEILVNLINNAVRYAPRSSPVRIAAEVVSVCGEQRVRIHVNDQGPGLSAEQQSRLFQRFGRVDPRPSASGLGLGLYICHAYATGMGGRMWVTSAIGQGATFTVELPAAATSGIERDPAR